MAPHLRGSAFVSTIPSFFPPPYGNLDAVLDSPAIFGAHRQLTTNVASLCYMVKIQRELVKLLRALQQLEAQWLDLTPYPQWFLSGQGCMCFVGSSCFGAVPLFLCPPGGVVYSPLGFQTVTNDPI